MFVYLSSWVICKQTNFKWLKKIGTNNVHVFNVCSALKIIPLSAVNSTFTARREKQHLSQRNLFLRKNSAHCVDFWNIHENAIYQTLNQFYRGRYCLEIFKFFFHWNWFKCYPEHQKLILFLKIIMRSIVRYSASKHFSKCIIYTKKTGIVKLTQTQFIY